MNKFQSIISASSDSIRCSLPKLLSFAAAFWIIYFGVEGYKALFPADVFWDFSLFGIEFSISAIGFLFGSIEVVIMAITYLAISTWFKQVKFVKISLVFIMSCFTIVSWLAIDSYMYKAYFDEYQKVIAQNNKSDVNTQIIERLELEIKDKDALIKESLTESEIIQGRIDDLSEERSTLTSGMNKEIARTPGNDWTQSPDASARIQPFIEKLNTNKSKLEHEDSLLSRVRKTLSMLDDQKLMLQSKISELHTSIESTNHEVGTESTLLKKKVESYGEFGHWMGAFFGTEMNDEEAFRSVVRFLAFLPYPVYILLNVFIGVNSVEFQTYLDNNNKNSNNNKKPVASRLVKFLIRNRKRKQIIKTVTVTLPPKEVKVEIPKIIEKPVIVEVPKVQQVFQRVLVMVPDSMSKEDLAEASGDMAKVITLEELMESNNA